ncbi:AAA family ATPase [Acinetobacter bereziniae]|uniref:AAA family ATPase n=1 Tax=Acinetobacter bereziniae TaxID=106648 RepID=UPI001902A724|nr:AAA family ATPase [Acinetobacter bereziniae]MBJ9948530.1 AAA family ATPase [Acinetobacter bereziniae]
MTTNLINLINEIQSFESNMEISALDISPTIRFSNTGARGLKFFDISIVVLKSIFDDIKSNLTIFQSISDYTEKEWRDTLSTHLTDDAAKALCTVQTLPLYTVVSKFISAVNKIPYIEKKMDLTASNVDNVISVLDSMITNLASPSTHTTSSVHVSKKIIPLLSTTPYKEPGENIIYFGAPGTGKSKAIDDLIDENNSVRTVFHSETYYSDFVGCLKPTMGTDGVEYNFQVGPFTETLINALNDPDHHYYLVIEEINRAKSAAVFGEIFQLLDRDNGESKYSIKINDQDLIKVFEQNLSTALTNNLIKIPKNLSILATMNTSDQAVEPMDTAFKRRWKYIYMPIDFDKTHEVTKAPLHAQGNFEIIRKDANDKNETIQISWKDLALKLNDFLSDLDVPEDRHLGPWFVKDDEILDLDKAKETLGSKILMYLWDDVLRHEGKSEIFTNEIKTYGQLISKLNSDEVIFNANFLNLFK